MTSYKVTDLQGASAGVVVDGEWISFISAVCTEYCRSWCGINAINTYTNLCCTQYSYLHYVLYSVYTVSNLHKLQI